MLVHLKEDIKKLQNILKKFNPNNYISRAVLLEGKTIASKAL